MGVLSVLFQKLNGASASSKHVGRQRSFRKNFWIIPNPRAIRSCASRKGKEKKKKFIKLLVKKLRVADARDPVHLRFPIILRGKWPRRENRRWVVFFKLRENKAIPVIAKFRTILKENRIVLFVCRVGGKIEIADWEDLAKFHTISVDENFGKEKRNRKRRKIDKVINKYGNFRIQEYVISSKINNFQ